jgi:protein involved in polysaccharide export with SLBB domain
MTATVLGVVAALLVGCASNRTIPNNPAQAGFAPTKVQRPPEYRMQPGDEMDIKFFFNPELDQTVLVRPDGKISLPVVDDVQAAGLTPSELDALLTQIYGQEIRKPLLTVIVKTFTGRQVYVGGEVGKPGVVQLGTHMTALQAVIGAGGFLETAKPEATLVIRQGGAADAPIPIRLDLEESIDGETTMGDSIDGETTMGDIQLYAGDIVYVPKTFIANANLFVKQYISQLLLFRGWGFDFNRLIFQGP